MTSEAANHTPGPYFAEEEWSDGYGRPYTAIRATTTGADGEFRRVHSPLGTKGIAYVLDLDQGGDRNEASGEPYPESEYQANLRLFLGAPELLDAARDCIYGDPSNVRDAMRRLREAVDRADGDIPTRIFGKAERCDECGRLGVQGNEPEDLVRKGTEEFPRWQCYPCGDAEADRVNEYEMWGPRGRPDFRGRR